MKKLSASAAMMGGIVFASLSSVMAQNLASTSEPRTASYVVFLDHDHQLSPTAGATIRSIAAAAHSAPTVFLSGKAGDVDAVEKMLLREGVPFDAIASVREKNKAPLPNPGDGVSDPSERRVRIEF